MIYLCITQVDAATRIPCTEAGMATGPSYPILPGLWVHFWDESNYPIQTDGTGRYVTAPIFWATCPAADGLDLTQPGILSVITKEEFETARYNEAYARKPFNSWVFDAENLSWSAPVPYPTDEQQYAWDEDTMSWVMLEHEVDLDYINGDVVEDNQPTTALLTEG
jgi:hypothetical protein